MGDDTSQVQAEPSADWQGRTLGPFFFSDRTIGVLEDEYVIGTASIASITGVRLETRSSFKHPLIGLVLGVLLLVPPGQVFLGDPLGLGPLFYATMTRVIGSVSMMFFGACLLWWVARRHDEPWIVFEMGPAERGFPLDGEPPADALAMIEGLCEIKIQDSRQVARGRSRT